MKLSKKTGLVIAAGIFVIVLAGLVMVYSQQLDEQKKLNEELAFVQSRLGGIQLEQLSSQQTELEKQLSQATTQFEAVKAILSQPVGSVNASSVLFALANAHNLEVTELASSTPATATLEGIDYSIISLTAKVEGNVPNLISFIIKLNSHFTTGVVESITVTIPETTSNQTASADIQLVIYTNQGG